MKLLKQTFVKIVRNSAYTLAGAALRFSEPSLGVLGGVQGSVVGHPRTLGVTRMPDVLKCMPEAFVVALSRPLLLSFLVPHQHTFFFLFLQKATRFHKS